MVNRRNSVAPSFESVLRTGRSDTSSPSDNTSSGPNAHHQTNGIPFKETTTDPRDVINTNQTNYMLEMSGKTSSATQLVEGDGGGYFDEPYTVKYRDNLQMTFYHAMSPLINAMRAFGLWHSHIIDPLGSRSKKKSIVGKVFNGYNYGLLVLLLLWINFLRFVPAFAVGAVLEPERLYFKMIYALFMLQCSLNHTAIFLAISRKGSLCRFFHHWEVGVQTHPLNAIDLDWLRRWSWTFAIVGIVYVTLHVMNQTFGVFGPVESIRNSSDIFVAPFNRHVALHFFVLLCNIYCFASWIFSILIYVLVCMCVMRQFGKFNARFGRVITKARAHGVFPEDFEAHRHDHEDLCYAIRLSNDHLFTYLNLISYATMVPLACFLLYNLLFSNSISGQYTAYLMYTIWLTSIFVNICVVSWIAALVSSTAHGPRELLFQLDLRNVTMDQLIQMHTFLARVSGEPIGFSIYDLVVLSKPFILTIGGLGITYYALISEVQTSGPSTLGT